MKRCVFRGVAVAAIVMVSTGGVAPAATVTTVPRSHRVTIELIAATLIRLGEPATAAKLKADFKGKLVRFKDFGGEGVNAETGQEGGRNVMDLNSSLLGSVAGLEKVLKKRPYGPSSVLVSVAVTVMHEYVHMRQKSPQNIPEFEDPAYLDVGAMMRRWLLKLGAERTALLAKRPSATQTVDLSELNDLAGQLKTEAAAQREAYDRNVVDGKVSPGLPVGFDQLIVRFTALQASLRSPVTTTIVTTTILTTTIVATTTRPAGSLSGVWNITANGHGGTVDFDKGTLNIDGFDEAIGGYTLEAGTSKVKFSRPRAAQEYVGVLSGTTMKGTFTQGGAGAYLWDASKKSN